MPEVGDMACDWKPKGEGAAESVSFGGAGAANSDGGSGDGIGDIVDGAVAVFEPVLAVVVLVAVVEPPAGAALMLRWTVSPSLMPSYSLSSRSSAIAFPLYSQRCLSGSGAPLAASCACSCAFNDATSAVGEQARVNVKGGLRDLTVILMVADEDVDGTDDDDAAVSAPPAVEPPVLVPASLLEMGSGGCTTGIWGQRWAAPLAYVAACGTLDGSASPHLHARHLALALFWAQRKVAIVADTSSSTKSGDVLLHELDLRIGIADEALSHAELDISTWVLQCVTVLRMRRARNALPMASRTKRYLARDGQSGSTNSTQGSFQSTMYQLASCSGSCLVSVYGFG